MMKILITRELYLSLNKLRNFLQKRLTLVHPVKLLWYFTLTEGRIFEDTICMYFFLGRHKHRRGSIKPIAYMHRYKECSCYRPVISVTVQALIKVSQPIARGEHDGSNQRSPTQSPIAASKPNFVAPSPTVIEPSTNVQCPLLNFPAFCFPDSLVNSYLALGFSAVICKSDSAAHRLERSASIVVLIFS